MGKMTIILMVITILSKVLGFVRESAMAAFVGAGELKSIYTTAITVPTFLSGIVISGIVSGYIPIFNKVKNEEGEERAQVFTNNLLNILMIFGLVAFAISFIFARPISKTFSPGLSGKALSLAANFTRIMGLTIFTFLYSSVIGGYLNIKGNFVVPIASGVILDIIVIVTTIMYGKLDNPYVLIVGSFIGYTFQYIRFPFVAKKLGFRHKKIIDFKDKYIKELLILIVPIIISGAADNLSIIVDNSMGSAYFGKDSVSQIYYAKTMLSFITGVATLTITTVTFPMIARLGQEGKIEEMKKEVASSNILAMLIVIPATLGMMVLASPIIKLAFERNAFTSSDTMIVSSLMGAYAPYIIFVSVIKVFSNAFYSVGESKIPVLVVLIQQAINFILNFLMIKFSGISGLAYATSISNALGCFMIIFAFYKRFGKLANNDNLIAILKVFLASLIMSLSAYFVFNNLPSRLGSNISLLIAVILAGLIYLGLVSISNIKEVEYLKEGFLKKIKNNN